MNRRYKSEFWRINLTPAPLTLAEIANNMVIGHRLDQGQVSVLCCDCKTSGIEVAAIAQLSCSYMSLIENANVEACIYRGTWRNRDYRSPIQGKTIILKTLGLAQIMAQSGLPHLADQVSRVGIFTSLCRYWRWTIDRAGLSAFSAIYDQYRIYLESEWIHLLDPSGWVGAEPIPQEGLALLLTILEDLRLRGD